MPGQLIPHGGGMAQIPPPPGVQQHNCNTNYSIVYNGATVRMCVSRVDLMLRMATCLPHAHSARWTINRQTSARTHSSSLLRGYYPCTQGIQKTILPSGRNIWQCGAESMCLANKCNSLVSASATSLDPILSSTSPSLLADDKFTVVTSNVTQLARSQHTWPSLAAIAWHLLGNPVPQYLNAKTITTHMAIADTGATSIVIMEGADVANKWVAQSLSQLIYPMEIKCRQHTFVTSTYQGSLQYWQDTLSHL